MDQINQVNNPNLSNQIEVNYQDKFYIAYLKTFEDRVQISFTIQEDYHLKWQGSYSVNQSFKIHKSFFLHENLQEVFEYLENLIKQSIKTISLIKNNMVVEFEIDLVGKKSQFSIQLAQCEYDTKEIINELIINLKKQSKNQQKLEQIIQDQEKEIQQIKSKLELYEDYFQRKQIKQQEKEASRTLNDIIGLEELTIIKSWVSNLQIDLKLIYRATIDGFQIEKIYEQCHNKKRVILLIRTTLGKRFGFYSDLEIKSYNGWIAQNPNNIFLFSLDLKQKYTSNDSNCNQAFYSCSSYFGIGGGHDICLYTNSNSSNKNYVCNHSYGKNQGLTRCALNEGNQNFQPSEVAIFEIKDF